MLFCIVSVSGNSTGLTSFPPDSSRKSDNWAYSILNIIPQKAKPGTVVKVAVVDDGFLLTHKALKNFVFTNEKEIPGNFQDDDNNGFVDDVHGWDISDADADVTVPKGRENFLFHGTYISGIITSVFQKCYGSEAANYLKIIPVKVLSDNAKNTYLSDGYKGLKYAIDMGSDIICCAWSGGTIGHDEEMMISDAIRKGIIIVGSSGNLMTEKADLPSSFPGVFCVAAVDSTLKKMKQSNYGMRIDISAPGVAVYGPYSVADNAFTYDDGTSPAAALITGCLAILKVLNPQASSSEILDAIRNTASPIDNINLTYCGKLGTGIPDMAKAAEYLSDPDFKFTSFNSLRPEGKIFYNKKLSPQSWEIHPSGAYKGIHIYSDSPVYKGTVKLYSGDSAVYSGAVGSISKGHYIPGSRFKIELQSRSQIPKYVEFSYYMETIDSSLLYCSGIQNLENDNGVITDNSGEETYANNTSCKWQITAPPKKRIQIEFENIDTQPNVDFIWIFDGNSTLQENVIAKFSGNLKPPVITSSKNQVLIWFITDATAVGKGWKLKYHFVD